MEHMREEQIHLKKQVSILEEQSMQQKSSAMLFNQHYAHRSPPSRRLPYTDTPTYTHSDTPTYWENRWYEDSSPLYSQSGHKQSVFSEYNQFTPTYHNQRTQPTYRQRLSHQQPFLLQNIPTESFCSLQNESTSSHNAPLCNPVIARSTANYLSSNEITKAKLIPPLHVISSNRHLTTEAKVSTLAVRLARESFFGEDVLRRCTVSGHRDLPGLPLKELNELKQTIFNCFPCFWKTPVEFEGLWAKCAEAIGQAAKGARKCA